MARKNPHAVELGKLRVKKAKPGEIAEMARLGGLKGGRARAVKLTADERQRIAKKAAKARWKK